MNVSILQHLKNFFVTRKDFQIMEANLKEFVAGDRKYLPSDGGLTFKIRKLEDKWLYEKYCKTAQKILSPVIQDYFEQHKNKRQELKEEYVDIDKYLNMSLEDLCNAGTDFYIPISTKIRYKGEELYLYGLEYIIFGGKLSTFVEQFVPEIYEKYKAYALVNCPLPPMPLEECYIWNNFILNYYMNPDNSHPRSYFETEEIFQNYITPVYPEDYYQNSATHG